MKLNQNQKVAIYASALQGYIVSCAQYETTGGNCKLTAVEYALQDGDALIAALEARKDENEADPTEEIPDA